MAGLLDRVRGILGTRDRAKPFSEQGVAGFAMFGGYVQTPETNSELIGGQRWLRAADLLSNISIIAASLRYTLNLISRPTWRFDPVNDTAEAKAAAEFMEAVINDTSASWTRVIRRAGMYRYHGFGVHEWVAKRREDGKIGIQSIESRPQHTIERWDIDENGGVLGVWQRDPQTARELYLPRQKLLYIVDDTLTDRPDGIGWFRHLVEPAHRLRSYLELEGIGFERDLSGIPIGRAPLEAINQLVVEGKITEADKSRMMNQLTNFTEMKRKKSGTGLVLDSSTYEGKSADGQSVSGVYKWDMDLLTGKSESIEELDKAVHRLQYDMALIMGTESMLVGREGEGSRALSEDKSRNMYLTANATLADMAESVDRDLRDPIWVMNGLDEKLKPKAKVEDVSFKDVEQIARVLADMATAGAILAPDDPAINDLRDLMGVQHAPEMDMSMLNALQGRPDPTKLPEDPKADLDDPANDNPNLKKPAGPRRQVGAARAAKGEPGKAEGPAARKAYNPDQPRAPAGADNGGQWVSAGTGSSWRTDADSAEIQTELYAEAREFFAEHEDEARAVQRYQRQAGGSSSEVNTYLRGGGTGDPKIDKAVAGLDAAVSANNLSGVELYRGASRIGDLQLPGDLTAGQGIVGMEGTELGYSSTSITPSNFLAGSNQMVRIKGADRGALVMAARDSKKIAQAVERSEILPEGAEVLLPRGSRFRITGVSPGVHPTIPDKTTLIYDAEIVGAAEKRAPSANLKTLYVNRPVTNAAEIIAWAKEQGFPKTVTADDLHVTICFSEAKVDWDELGDSFDTLRVEAGPRAIEAFGKKGEAIVLTFELQELTDRWQQFIDAGASWKHKAFRPHLTMTYDGQDLDTSEMQPYTGPIELGPEEFSELNDDWADQVIEKRMLGAVNSSAN